MLRILIVPVDVVSGSWLQACLEQHARLSDAAARMIDVVDRNAFALSIAGPPDIALVGHAEPLEDTLSLLATLRASHPECKLIITDLPAVEVELLGDLVLRYVEAGALSYLRCGDSCASVREVIAAVERGEAPLEPELASDLVERLVELRGRLEQIEPERFALRDLDELTERQREVLALLAEDLTNAEIAERLFISVGTVKNHVHGIFEKLGLPDREAAAAYFREMQREPSTSVEGVPSPHSPGSGGPSEDSMVPGDE